MSTIFLRLQNEPDRFWSFWDECVNLTQAGPRYARSNVEWIFSIARSRNLLVEDRSFVYVRNGKPLAAVLLPVETHAEQRRMSQVGDFIYAPLFVDASVRKEVFGEIDRIAKELQVAAAQFSVDPLSDEPYNYLQSYGYLDTTILNYCIDLTPENLLAACRHGHKYDINTMRKMPNVSAFVCDANTPDARAHHDAYRELHRKCSGRETRPKETFDLQFEQLITGDAILVGVKHQEQNVAYAYFQLQHGKSVYASGADDPDCIGLALYHLMIFTAMNAVRERGAHIMDTGQPSSPSPQFHYAPDHKQLNIGLFKRGFPGAYRSNFRGVRYYSRDAFAVDQARFAGEYPALTNLQDPL